MTEPEDTRRKFSFTLPGIYLGWLGLFILFAAFTGHCNLWGCGFERDYLGEILDR